MQVPYLDMLDEEVCFSQEVRDHVYNQYITYVRLKERAMLEGLSSINWSELSHAYGSADEVPQLISDLASLDNEVSGRALGILRINLYHQGTIYQASAYSAPFLIELVPQDEVLDRDGILLLLARLATGNAYHRQHMHYYSEEKKQDPEFQRELEQQVFWVDRTHQPVEAGIPIYLRLLN